MNVGKIKGFFMAALFEYSIAGIFLAYLLSYELIGLPSVQELIAMIERGFAQYGLFFLFFGVILEGLFIVGFYFPGSIIAFSAVIFLGKNQFDILQIIIVGSVALIIVSSINYWLGRYGYYRLFKKLGAEKTLQRMEKRFNSHYKKTVFISSSSPNFLAIASVYAGIARVKLLPHLLYLSVCVVFWVSLMAELVFLFASTTEFIQSENFGWYSFGILLIWALFESISFLRNNKEVSAIEISKKEIV
jgi:membrane protein DedA with SNARE-associated domain